ncbi:hypothetical protein LARI1_G007302 [Lachnellula arida]|uniref:Fungal N-terminal domain-containing protein n=1 Tax=Lachnellula arida TaxID=1316785 RepID=A0A8T9B592_9HELO|nr:hypothetical protein LARI1_G007302 [Lachnellula arida]
MAEAIAAIGIVASVVQLADFGFKLSVKLFTFSKAVASADTSIQEISNDVSLTSTVLSELCQILQADESHVVSENALEATRQTVNECMSIFEQLDDALDRSLRNLGMLEEKGIARRGRVALEKLKWPFKQNKMELLRSNLERLKASLALMLQVLSYAREISSRKAADSSFAYQKHLIESLARSEQETKRRYHALQMAIESEKSERGLNAFISTSVHVTGASGMDTMSQPSETPAVPAIKHETLVGEILLCFQLLNDVLGNNLAVSTLSELSSLGYEHLRLTLERIHTEEINQLNEDFANASNHAKAEAVKNLEARLKELVRAGILKGQKQEENTTEGNQNTTETSVPQPSLEHNVQTYSAWEPSIDTPVTKSSKGTVITVHQVDKISSTSKMLTRAKDTGARRKSASPVTTEVENKIPPAVAPETETQSLENRLAGDDKALRLMPSMSSVEEASTGYYSSTTYSSDFDAEEEVAAEALRIAEEQDARQYESDESDSKGIDLGHDIHNSHGIDTEGEGSVVVEYLLSRWTTLSPSTY